MSNSSIQSRNYKMAVALLRFKQAYKDLVDASQEMPDLDVSKGYPFYLLDFEEIAPAVIQWCMIHAAKLMEDLPLNVDNPACVECEYFRSGITNGLCKGTETTHCSQFPFVPFTREIAEAYLKSISVDTQSLKDNEIHLIYLQRMEAAYANKKSSQGGTDKPIDM